MTNAPTPGTSTQLHEEDTKPQIKEECQSQTSEVKKKPVQYFHCSTCSLKEKFDYFGNKPSKMKRFRYAENCYVMVDPFVPPNKGEYLILGTHCIKCNRTVCRDTSCSFYFDGTYCISCAKECANTFPKAVQDKLSKITQTF